MTDFHTWLQCSLLNYTSVLGGTNPSVFPELMAYLITISMVSQDFSGLSWVRCDSAFRRQAAITGNKHWPQITPSLYSICFTEKAQTSNRCELCMSVSHGTKQCPLQVNADPDLPIRLTPVESAVVSLASRSQRESSGTQNTGNRNQCRQAHPAIRCPIASQAKGVSTVETTGDARKGSPAGTRLSLLVVLVEHLAVRE